MHYCFLLVFLLLGCSLSQSNSSSSSSSSSGSVSSSISMSSSSSVSSSSFVPPNGTLPYFLQMGTIDGSPTLVVNGIPDYSYVVDGTKDESDFFIWLGPTAPIDSMIFHHLKNNFRNPENLGHMKAHWLTHGNVVHPHRGGGLLDSYIRIIYSCEEDRKEAISSQLNMTIGFPNTTWDNITIKWRKVCGPRGDDGWNSASIFFFTVFLLGLVLCVVGCLYNYVQQNRTGCDVIPGIDIYRNCFQRVEGCFGRCFKEPRYSPQVDYDNPIDDSDYGASYQTNL